MRPAQSHPDPFVSITYLEAMMTTSDSIPTKRCSQCKTEKPFTEFHKLTKKLGTPNAPRAECKECAESKRRKRMGRVRRTNGPFISGHPYLTVLARFFHKIKVDPEITYKGVPCWLFQSSIGTDGYGYFGINFKCGINYKQRAAHIIAYELFVGPIPDGLECDHLCRVRRCANPVHIEPVPHQVNVARGDWGPERKTHCPHGHEYTPENTYYPPVGGRACRACIRRWDKERWPRRKKSDHKAAAPMPAAEPITEPNSG